LRFEIGFIMNQNSTPATSAMLSLAHSEEYFGHYRDFWWNADFLELMARRWRLSQYHSVLDVGCGQCHWSRLLLPHLQPHSHITALDQDPKWAQGNDTLVGKFAEYGATIEFRHGDAQCLPFNDDCFDVVTCQTVLIHVADPLSALKEMRRVTRPGGLVICSEPNNLVGAAIVSAANVGLPTADRVAEFRYRLLCETAKQAAGEGNSSLGDQLGWLFQKAGFADIQSYLSDKAAPLLPPYCGNEQLVMVDQIKEELSVQGRATWNEHVRRWLPFLQSREDTDFMISHLAGQAVRDAELDALVANNAYWSGGPTVMYLVSAQK
jgi:ubiquinone/menaquinone biosynthesis C-methylase UbiE